MTPIKHKIIYSFLAFLLLGSLLLIASFHIEMWYLELLTSFTPFLITALFVALGGTSALLFIWRSNENKFTLPLMAILTWMAAFLTVFQSYSIQNPVELKTPTGEAITFATFNKLYSNTDIERFTDYFREQEIDILALQEVRPAEVTGIAQELGLEFTHTSRTFATSGGTSVALFSKFPFESAETIELDTGHPVARAVVRTPSDENIAVYSVHFPVPSSPYLYKKRNVVLDSFKQVIQEEELPVLVGGDFNTTVFSPVLRDFSNSVRPSIRQVITEAIPSCSWYGYGSLLCIRIDHIYIPEDMKLLNFRIAPDLGADHRALIAEVQI